VRRACRLLERGVKVQAPYLALPRVWNIYAKPISYRYCEILGDFLHQGA
jgi:hypothetical protein